jgi:hypothetical protein
VLRFQGPRNKSNARAQTENTTILGKIRGLCYY